MGRERRPTDNALHALLGGGAGAGVVAAGGVGASVAGAVGNTNPFLAQEHAHAARMHAQLRGYPGVNGATGPAPGPGPGPGPGGFYGGASAAATSAAPAAAPGFAPPDAFGAAPRPGMDLGRVHTGAGSPFKGGGDGMGPRNSSFQHLGMIEGVLGEESSFFGA